MDNTVTVTNPDVWSIYTAPAEAIEEPLLRNFMEAQLSTRLFAESLTLELKRKRRGDNMARAIAAMANADGGIILLGLTAGRAAAKQLGIAHPKDVSLGEQPWTVGPIRVFVVPNSSGAHATMPHDEKLRWWTQFRQVTL